MEVWIYANGIFCFHVSGGMSLYVCVIALPGSMMVGGGDTLGTHRIGKGIWDPERAERVGSQEVRVQSTWVCGRSRVVAFRLGGEMKSRRFRAQGGVRLQVADLWCSTALQDLGAPCRNRGKLEGETQSLSLPTLMSVFLCLKVPSSPDCSV